MANGNASALKLRGQGQRNVLSDFIGEKAEPESELEKMNKLAEETEKNKLEKRMNAR